MNQDLSISFGAPYITMEEFAKNSGMELNTIKRWVQEGKLPIRKKDIAGKRSIVLINNAALTIEALKDRSPRINV